MTLWNKVLPTKIKTSKIQTNPRDRKTLAEI